MPVASDGPSEERPPVVVLNPTSGSEDHVARVEGEATARGWRVRTTGGAGDAARFARQAAADGAEAVVAAGGDGTIHEVVRGLDAAGVTVPPPQADGAAGAEAASAAVTLGILPAGTGNNFATNLGIETIEAGFRAVDDGQRRRIDLGVANEEPFTNSCIAGLTATASAETDPEQKRRFGVFAYVLTTLETATGFDGLDVEIDPVDPASPGWTGEAIMLLIGNARRFPVAGRTQADVEDGLLDVTVVEDRPTMDLAGEAAISRFLGAETAHITRLQTPALRLAVDGEPTAVSLDGEMIEATELAVSTRHRALRVCVGEGYDPSPDQ